MLLEKLSNIDLLFLVVYVVISVTQETCIRTEDNGDFFGVIFLSSRHDENIDCVHGNIG